MHERGEERSAVFCMIRNLRYLVAILKTALEASREELLELITQACCVLRVPHRKKYCLHAS